jgi:hypothetical protein
MMMQVSVEVTYRAEMRAFFRAAEMGTTGIADYGDGLAVLDMIDAVDRLVAP